MSTVVPKLGYNTTNVHIDLIRKILKEAVVSENIQNVQKMFRKMFRTFHKGGSKALTAKSIAKLLGQCHWISVKDRQVQVQGVSRLVAVCSSEASTQLLAFRSSAENLAILIPFKFWTMSKIDFYNEISSIEQNMLETKALLTACFSLAQYFNHSLVYEFKKSITKDPHALNWILQQCWDLQI